MNRCMLWIVVAVWALVTGQPAAAQQVYYSSPLVSLNDSFYEWYGIDWGYQARGPNGNFFFNRGGSQGTIPPFGGFDPASAARLGFSHQGSNHGFFFNLTAAQGSNRTITSTTPSVMVSNGAIGSVRDVRMRPFVTGLIPVVGSGAGSRVPPPTLISPLKERLARLRAGEANSSPQPQPQTPVAAPTDPISPDLVLGSPDPPTELKLGGATSNGDSTAARGDISVAEIRRRQLARAQAAADELDRLVEEARAAEGVGRFGAARVRYRQAAARASGDLKRVLLEKLESIRDR